jgi:NADH:ubiquinone reductase (non-electrogenic)
MFFLSFSQYTYKRLILQQSGLDIEFSEAECYKIDPKNNKVYCRASNQDKKLGGIEEFSIDYDYLCSFIR